MYNDKWKIAETLFIIMEYLRHISSFNSSENSSKMSDIFIQCPVTGVKFIKSSNKLGLIVNRVS